MINILTKRIRMTIILCREKKMYFFDVLLLEHEKHSSLDKQNAQVVYTPLYYIQ